MRFKDKIVAITGGGSGIGKETAARFAAEGASVVLGGRDLAKLEAAAREIDPSGARVAVSAGDIADPATGAALVDLALARFGKLDRTNTGAVAAHYGSVSVVTFVTASQVYGNSGFVIAGFMVAVLAMMETPAILSGLFLARREGGRMFSPELLREVFFNGSVVLLLGSFAIGIAIGEDGFEPVSPLFRAGFTGVLCLFLLDMGLIAMRRIMKTRALTWRLALLAILFPIVNGTIGALVGTAIGLDAPSAAGLAILAASASYIAVPAAMRLSLPQADAGLYLAMSLGVTFPFNIVLGIPLYRWMAENLGAIL